MYSDTDVSVWLKIKFFIVLSHAFGFSHFDVRQKSNFSSFKTIYSSIL